MSWEVTYTFNPKANFDDAVSFMIAKLDHIGGYLTNNLPDAAKNELAAIDTVEKGIAVVHAHIGRLRPALNEVLRWRGNAAESAKLLRAARAYKAEMTVTYEAIKRVASLSAAAKSQTSEVVLIQGNSGSVSLNSPSQLPNPLQIYIQQIERWHSFQLHIAQFVLAVAKKFAALDDRTHRELLVFFSRKLHELPIKLSSGVEPIFLIQWKKVVQSPGRFRFTTQSKDGIKVSLNDKQIINAWYDHDTPSTHQTIQQLTAFDPECIVRYYWKSGSMRASLTIQRVDEMKEEDIRKARQKLLILKKTTTHSGLKAAKIVPVDEKGKPTDFADEMTVHCLFNPYEYTIKKKNKYKLNGFEKFNYNVDFQADKVQPRTLMLSALYFDTTESGLDVRIYTDTLMRYCEMQGAPMTKLTEYAGELQAPPRASFEWGTFRFLGVIESVKVDYILFKPDGTPVRAKVTIQFKEFKHRQAYPKQNPTSGDGPAERLWTVARGDRLDLISAQIYGDATQWRRIATANNILDPLVLQPGTVLNIPPRWEV